MAGFAEMLKYFREREGLTQRELAEKLQLSAGAIGMYESGKRHPRYEDEEAIADFFNVDINTLRGRRIPEEPEYDPQTRKVIELYQSVPRDVQDAVLLLLKSARRDS